MGRLLGDPAAAAAATLRRLGLLGLGDQADQRTDQLSGGERQRVALAVELTPDEVGDTVA